MDLFDFITNFLEVIILLLAKFWYIIFAFLGYLLFGKNKSEQKRNKRPFMPPFLTPTQDGGFPKPYQAAPVEHRQEEMNNRDVGEASQSATLDDAEPESTEMSLEEESEPTPTDNEWKETEDSKQEKTLVPLDAKQESVQPWVDAREGMKWAMIFSPPRAKDPYMPPYLQAKRK